MKSRIQMALILSTAFSICESRAALKAVRAETIEKSGTAVAGHPSLRAEVAEVHGVWTNGEGCVAWQLGSSWGTAGFYVYRVNPESGVETPLNNSLLPAAFYQSDAVYELADPEACEGGAGTYRLEEVELSGAVLDLGEHAVVFAPPPPGPKIVRAVKTSGRARLAATKAEGTSSVLKVLLKKEGIYGVSLESIANGMGLALENVQALAEAGSLRFMSQGRPVPVLYDAARGQLVFHGKPTDNWYTRDAAYLISVGAGLPMLRRDPGATEGETVFPVQIHFEQDRFPLDGVTEIPDDFYYWNFIISTTDPELNRVDFAIDLNGYEGGALTLKVDLRGWSKTSTQNPDHRAEFSLNGTAVGAIEFDDQDAATAELAIPAGIAVNGANTLTVRGALATIFNYSYFVLDGITAEYDRTLAPLGDTAYLRAGVAASVSAAAFTEPLALALDEEGWYPTWIADENGELPAKAWAVSSENERFAVIEAGAVPLLEPEPAAADAWFLAETNRIDYLVIASRALAPAAQELADYRASQGWRVGVAVFEDVCDLMYDGLRTPEAIPELLSYAAAVWAEPPQMVVLAGNGHDDYLGALSNEVNHLPPMLLQTADGFFAADGLLAESGGEAGPDVAIGRLPARSAEELTAMIAKIEAYEAESGAPWQSEWVFAADKADAAGDFQASNTRLEDLVASPYAVAAQINLDTMSIGAARTALMNGFNDGAGFIHYTGHGTSSKLSSQGLLTTADVNAMSNARQPVVVASCCLAGHYEAPAVNSLGELLMQRAQGGAVAVWASSGLARNAPSTDLAEAFYRAVLQEGAGTLGPAILGALQSLPSDDLFTRDTFATYNLLGDPALRIGAPMIVGALWDVNLTPAQVFLEDLHQTYNGASRTVMATTDPEGLPVEFAYDGEPTAPTAAGTYEVFAWVSDTNYDGFASGTLVVAKADQTIDFPSIADQWITNSYALAASASSGLPVGFAVASGPGHIDGTGTSLAFTGTGTVSIVASQPGDDNWNPALDVIHTFQVMRPEPIPEINRTNVNVKENGEGRFFLRLDRAPTGTVVVSVSRSAGDTNLVVGCGATRTFKPSNWSAWQAVTLVANNDGNGNDEVATFRISGPGGADQFVQATALDDDIGANLALASSGSKITGGSLAAKSIDGIHTTNVNYGYMNSTNVPPGAMTLDLKAAKIISRVRVLNWDWDARVHRYKIESSLDGATWTLLVDASTGAHQGWEDWAMADRSVRYLRLTGLSNSANALVCIAEWEVYRGRPVPVANTTHVNVRENGEGRFFVKLDRAPVVGTTMTVTPSGGDTNVAVQSGGTLAFTPANWSVWQAVTLAAADDGDAANGTATFQIAIPGEAPQTVTATELDDDIGANLALASSGSKITGGSLAAKSIDGIHTTNVNYGYMNSTNVPPGAMTLDLRAAKVIGRVRVLNWNWDARVHRYKIESSLDGANWSLLVDASTEDRQGWDDWAVVAQSVRYLRFTGLSNSANALVCIPEWEVYAGELPVARPARRSVAQEKSMVPAVQPVATGAGMENGPVTVVTSDDGPEHTNGWAAVDGDTNTLWTGKTGAGGWHIAIGYESTLTVTHLAIDVAEGSLTDVQILTSLDGEVWQAWPEDPVNHPVKLNYLWVLFPGDGGSSAEPKVIEICPQP